MSNETAWRKSSYSGATSGNCVEVADATGIILVRDTKNRDGFTLGIPASEWRRFGESLKSR